MASLNASSEKISTSLLAIDEGPNRVFQPPQLTEIVAMIDLMAEISTRVREDSSTDMGGVSLGRAQSGVRTKATWRDLALASLPATPVMQQKLVSHIEKEISKLEADARRLAGMTRTGSPYLLNEVYKKIRRFYGLIEEILQAAADVVRRFYVAVFIDHQPLLVDASALRAA